MNLFNTIEKLINEHGSATILKERISLLKDKYESLESEIETLRSQTENYRRELENKEQEINNLESALEKFNPQFTDIRGLKIKRLPDGSYEKGVAYCFQCCAPLSSYSKMKPLECSVCGYKTSVQLRHISMVVAELEGEDMPDWWKKKH